MSDLTREQEEDLKFLRSLKKIIIPKEFTYWCHSTMYKPVEDCVSRSDDRCWNEIPTNMFTTKKEMSFVTRMQRVKSALDHGNKPAVTYANTADSFPFQIRVLQARNDKIKVVYSNPEDAKRHFYWDRGLGDGRHPKLPSKTDVYIISFAQKDDVSNQYIDIVYGVVKEDISLIAKLIREQVKDINPEICVDYDVVSGYPMEKDRALIIERTNDRSRFFDTNIIGKSKEIVLVEPAGYKQDYQKMKQQKKQIK